VGVLVICVLVFTVLYCLYCVFVLFGLCIFILICFACSSVRTTATGGKLIFQLVIVIITIKLIVIPE
jgi:hypothetical protein